MSGDVAAIVLCGGTSRRMGGVDKTAADLDGRPVLDTLLASLPADWAVVCVGEQREVCRPVTWTREDPPLGGPVAGIAAGLLATQTHVPVSEVVVVLAGDQPFAGDAAARCVETLTQTRMAGADAVAALQPDGRPQPLLAAYRRPALGRALAESPSTGAGVHRTLSSLRIEGLPSPARATLDVDTPLDLQAARQDRAQR